jgi:hypothetical protein
MKRGDRQARRVRSAERDRIAGRGVGTVTNHSGRHSGLRLYSRQRRLSTTRFVAAGGVAVEIGSRPHLAVVQVPRKPTLSGDVQAISAIAAMMPPSL